LNASARTVEAFKISSSASRMSRCIFGRSRSLTAGFGPRDNSNLGEDAGHGSRGRRAVVLPSRWLSHDIPDAEC
jgi:hypothetical protein